MHELDLTDNLRVVSVGRHLLIEDPRALSAAPEGPMFYRRVGAEYRAVLAVFEAGHRSAGGRFESILSLDLTVPHALYGRKVLEGTAVYADGSSEGWRLQADPLQMRILLTRQPQGNAPIVLHLLVPAAGEPFELWMTESGARAGASPLEDRLEANEANECLYLSRWRRHCFRIETALPGRIALEKCAQVEGLPVQTLNGGGAWRLAWTTPAAAVHTTTLNWGVQAAVNEAAAARGVDCVDASHDFGPFFSQMAACSLPLHLDARVPGHLARRALSFRQDVAPALREVAWMAEFTYLLAPAAVARVLEYSLAQAQQPREEDSADETAALCLMMAWRHHVITGDDTMAKRVLPFLRECGARLLSLRREHDALPIVTGTYAPLGAFRGKDPYFTALAHTGLKRLAALERLADAPESDWDTAAEMMRLAATSPWEGGGLWRPGQHGFIQLQDYGVPESAGPGGLSLPGTEAAPEPEPRTAYAHYAQIAGFLLGLAESEEIQRGSYEWLDDLYSYATGRGGATFPPGMVRTFFALADVYLRKRLLLPGVNRLLQRALDQAFCGGAPLPAQPPDCGASRGRIGDEEFGLLWDNSPYFGLVLGEHYGLDYSAAGWHLTTPNPLAYYRLTRVTNLRHGHARYAVTWQGEGRLRRVLLDGKPLSSKILAVREGEHEVTVSLG